jgi:hypothetical protein
VKFTCDRCGKKYATAETLAPGRTYKLKCKACGHLIVVRGAAVAPASDAAPPPDVVGPAPHPQATPLDEVSAPVLAEPAPAAADAVPVPADTPRPPPVPRADATQEISTTSGLAFASPEEEPRPAQGDGGYVDLFADASKTGITEPAPPQASPVQAAPRDEAPPPEDDPFIAAARASLPDGFAPTRTPDPVPAPAIPKIPVIPKPPQQRSALPFVLIGVGGLVLVGILAFVLLGKGPAPAPPPPVPQAAAKPPAAPAPAPVAAAPAAPAAEDPRAAEERRDRERAEKEARAREEREREKAAQDAKVRDQRDAKARAEREARERDRLAREQREAKVRQERDAREQEEREARLREDREDRELRDRERFAREQRAHAAADGDIQDALGQDAIKKVVSSSSKAFESCIAASGRSGEVKLDGRRVTLLLNVQNTGAVYPTLDDVTLSGTELGKCLKGAARQMDFPAFRGDPVQVEVPLVLAAGR